MKTATLDDFMALNDQLAALVEAGVPIDLDLGQRQSDVVSALERINAVVARRVSQGASLASAIESGDQTAPAAYWSFLQQGLRSGDLSSALSSSSRFARDLENASSVGRQSLVYPAIVCCLAFIGFVGFCLFLVPVLDHAYRGMGAPVGVSLRVVEALRGSLPYWAAILPVGLLLLVGWQRRSKPLSARSIHWLPGMSRALMEERAGKFAESLATLLESGTPLSEALDITAAVWSDKSRIEATRALSARLSQGQPLSVDSYMADVFPPFLRWALLQSEESAGRVSNLRLAADVYQQTAQRRLERIRVVAPVVAAVVIGGSAVLLYGLTLFLPVVGLLRGLAS